jgi:hypothetical protein
MTYERLSFMDMHRICLAALVCLTAACGGDGVTPAPGPGPAPLVPVSDNAGLPDSLAQIYRADAVTLAARLGKSSSAKPELQAVELPVSVVESLFRALAAVHQATSLPARDSVVVRYKVHTFPEAQEILVGIQPSTPWLAPWTSGRLPTGTAGVDSLIAPYGLTVKQIFDWNIGRYLLVGTTRAINASALAARFARAPFVRNAEPNAVGGDGNNIAATPRGDGWTLDYSVGYGDCPAGCINRHTWSFAVDAAGRVTYLGSRGDPAP